MKKLFSQKTFLVVLALAVVLRFVSINQSFWLDEATSATVARDFSLAKFFNEFLPSDFHPPLYYLALRTWVLVFGASEIAVRSLSLFFSLFSLVLIYRIARELFGRQEGFASLLLLATSPLHFYYSQEARMYMMALFLVSWSFYLYLVLQKRPEGKTLVLFTLVNVFIVATFYLASLIFLVYLFDQLSRERGERKVFFSSLAVSLGLSLSLVPLFINQLKAGFLAKTSSPLWWNILGRTTIKEILLVPTKFIFGRVSFEPKALYGLLAVVFIGFYSFLIVKGVFKGKGAKLVGLWLAIPAIVSLCLGLVVPVFSYTRLLFILPAFYLLVVHGLYDLRLNKYLPLFILVNLLFVVYYLISPRFHREDWRSAVFFISAEQKDNSIVLFPADSQQEAFLFYAKDIKIDSPLGFDEKYQEIWLSTYVEALFDPQGQLRAKIVGSGYFKDAVYDFNGVVFEKYSR